MSEVLRHISRKTFSNNHRLTHHLMWRAYAKTSMHTVNYTAKWNFHHRASVDSWAVAWTTFVENFKRLTQSHWATEDSVKVLKFSTNFVTFSNLLDMRPPPHSRPQSSLCMQLRLQKHGCINYALTFYSVCICGQRLRKKEDGSAGKRGAGSV